MKLTVLGSGSPEPYARRASSGYLLDIGGEKLLFDCGGGVVSRMLEAGIDPTEIDYLFFSHLHSDHMIDYARLIHAAWETGDKRIKVFGPPPLAHIHDRLFGSDGALAHDLRARTEFVPSQEVWRARGGTVPRPWPSPDITEVQPGFHVDGGIWKLTSCEVPHAQPHLECMAFRVEAGGKSFVYSGDAGICDDLGALCQNADLLLHWCYRADGESVHPDLDRLSPTPGQIAKFASETGVKRLLLTHFRAHMDADAPTQAAKHSLAEHFGPDTAIVEDLEVFDI